MESKARAKPSADRSTPAPHTPPRPGQMGSHRHGNEQFALPEQLKGSKSNSHSAASN